MCELFAMSFNQPVKPSLSFRGFRHRGDSNRDGWGLAFYPDTSVQVIKEEITATESTLSNFLRDYSKLKSNIFIAHVRIASRGEVSHKNSHPFYRELGGEEYVFAHNGTLNDYRDLALENYHPVGNTDSEYAFCHILQSIKERRLSQWEFDDFDWLKEKLREINNYGNFNCIFSNGEYLFCYYDQNGYNGLCLVKREAPFNTVHLKDEDFEIDLSEEKDPSQKGFIVATRRLTNERWESFNPGELIVFRDGNIIFSSSGRDVVSFQTTLKEKDINILRVLRQSSHRVSLVTLYQTLDIPKKEITQSIHTLLCKGIIKQDSRDNVKWNQDGAIYYTNAQKRDEIDGLIKE